MSLRFKHFVTGFKNVHAEAKLRYMISLKKHQK